MLTLVNDPCFGNDAGYDGHGCSSSSPTLSKSPVRNSTSGKEIRNIYPFSATNSHVLRVRLYFYVVLVAENVLVALGCYWLLLAALKPAALLPEATKLDLP